MPEMIDETQRRERLLQLRAEYRDADHERRRQIEMEMIDLTEALDYHGDLIEDWDYPCYCWECRSYGD